MPALILMATLRGHRRGVWAAQFSPVDKCVVTAAGDKTLRLWSLADASCLRTFEGHTASVLRVSFLTAGTQLLSSGADGLVKLWSVRSSECVNTFDEHEGKARTLILVMRVQQLPRICACMHLWQMLPPQTHVSFAGLRTAPARPHELGVPI